MKELSEEKLWDYAEGKLPVQEANEVKKFIENNPEYKQNYLSIKKIITEVSELQLDAPSMHFSKGVMQQIITQTALKTQIDLRIIKGIGIFFGALIVILLLFTFSMLDFTATSTILQLPEVKLPQWITQEWLLRFVLMLDVLLLIIFADKIFEKVKWQRVYNEK